MTTVQAPLTILQYNRDDEDAILSGLKNQSQSQKRRILDLEHQFEDARARLDKLLQRKSLRRNTYDSSVSLPLSARSNSSSGGDISSESIQEIHTTKININPNNAKQSFGTVTLTVQVDEEEV